MSTSSGSGKHRDGGGRGVDAALGLRLRHALDAVAAALELEVPERALAGDAERDLAEAAQLGRHQLERLELPAHLLGVAAVHLEQVAGEQGRLVAAGAGADLDDQGRMVGAGLAIVEQVAERLAVLRLAGAEGVELGLGVGPHLGVGLGGAELSASAICATELEVAAVGQRDLGQRTPFLRQGRDRASNRP